MAAWELRAPDSTAYHAWAIGEAANAVIRQARPGQLIRVVETPDDLILISDTENKGVFREQHLTQGPHLHIIHSKLGIMEGQQCLKSLNSYFFVWVNSWLCANKTWQETPCRRESKDPNNIRPHKTHWFSTFAVRFLILHEVLRIVASWKTVCDYFIDKLFRYLALLASKIKMRYFKAD